jgi:arginyl-tRNA--protein-N-Asp/Glu arginylyltransferase
MYFQKEPVFTAIILGIGVVLYLVFRARKTGKSFRGFMGGNEQPQRDTMNDLMTLIVLQQLFSDRESTKSSIPSKPSFNASNQCNLKKQVLELFDKYDAENHSCNTLSKER